MAFCRGVEPEDKPVKETTDHLSKEIEANGGSQNVPPAAQITSGLK